MEKTINSSIHNNKYEDKVLPYQSSKFVITKYVGEYDCPTSIEAQKRVKKWLHSYKSWDKTAIDDRQQMLYEICENIWSIENIDF